MNYLVVSMPGVSSVEVGSNPFWGFAASPLPAVSTLLPMPPVNGGLTTSRGKSADGEPLGDGGLLLTSLTVDRVSTPGEGMAKEEGVCMCVGPEWTLMRKCIQKYKTLALRVQHWSVNSFEYCNTWSLGRSSLLRHCCGVWRWVEGVEGQEAPEHSAAVELDPEPTKRTTYDLGN